MAGRRQDVLYLITGLTDARSRVPTRERCSVNLLKSLNLALAFFLELGVLAALAYWGWQTGNSSIMQIGLGISAPAAAIGVWAVRGAPKSTRRLTGGGLLALRIVFFGTGALALVLAGQAALGIGFGLIAALNLGLMYAWRQDTKLDHTV